MKTIHTYFVFVAIAVLPVLLISCNNKKEKSRNMQASHLPDQGMNEKNHSDTSVNYMMQLSHLPSDIEAGKPVTFLLTPKNLMDSTEKVGLEIAHEKYLHLIIVSEDLSWFNHVHPVKKDDGSYVVNVVFPFGGKYLLYADYKPVDKPQIVNKLDVSVKGNLNKSAHELSAKAVSVINDYTIRLVNAEDLKSNNPQQLAFSIEKNGKKIEVKEIEPYLGGIAHLVLIGQDDKDYLHIHPSSTAEYTVVGHTNFNHSGFYRLWLQFQIHGKVFTADFSVLVKEGTAQKDTNMDMHHEHKGM